MIQLYDGGVYLVNGKDIVPEQEAAKVQQLTGKTVSKEDAKKGREESNWIKIFI